MLLVLVSYCVYCCCTHTHTHTLSLSLSLSLHTHTHTHTHTHIRGVLSAEARNNKDVPLVHFCLHSLLRLSNSLFETHLGPRFQNLLFSTFCTRSGILALRSTLNASSVSVCLRGLRRHRRRGTLNPLEHHPRVDVSCNRWHGMGARAAGSAGSTSARAVST